MALLLGSFLVTLAAVVAQDGPVGADSLFLDAVVERRSAAVTAFAQFVTHAGSPGVMALLAVAVASVAARRARSWRFVLSAVLVVGSAQESSTLLKAAVGRARPPLSERVAHVSAGGLAFPSGHATAAAASCGFLAALVYVSGRGLAARRFLLVLLAASVVAVGWSRVYLGVHWPTDVLGGWLLGLFWASVGSALLLRPVP